MSDPSRREVLGGLGALATLAALPGALRPAAAATPAAGALQFGCAAITWQGQDRQAIEDVAALGFPGIQLRSNVVSEFGSRPEELRALLGKHGLTLAALSSGDVRADAPAAEQIDRHLRHARFVRHTGGLYLQLIDKLPKGRPGTDADRAALGRLMTEIGKRSAELGIPVGYHNHMKSLGERPEEVDRVLEAIDPRYVKLALDVAHYTQGGGDPAQAIKRYGDRLLFLHLKDVQPAPGTADGYRFVPLGRGRVDLPGVFAALAAVGFRGWAIVELDSVTDPGSTPKQANAVSKRYLEETLGQKVVRG